VNEKTDCLTTRHQKKFHPSDSMSSELEEYRSRQREKWSGGGSVPSATIDPPVTSAPPTRPDPQATTSAPENVVHSSSANLSKVHILPVGVDIAEPDRLRAATQFLSSKLASNSSIVKGEVFKFQETKYVVVGTDPIAGGSISRDTDFFVSGPPVTELSKLQLVALLGEPSDTSPQNDEEISDKLFRESLGPYIEGLLGFEKSLLISNQEIITVGNVRYVATAMDPIAPVDNGGLSMITKDTLVYIDVDQAGEFARVHVPPFQDTLPRVYDFDIFEDYLRPYFSMNPMNHYSVNTQFVFHGVQFKVVCVDPAGDNRPRRIGPSTMIHCEGLLHASLRNILPPELLEQLSTLPPGLQMLLINTELLASADMLDRFIDLQETLAARRGVSSEVLSALPTEEFREDTSGIAREERPENATQCMICLSDFASGESIRRLPCTHVYHQPCIDEWLHRCTDCPLCKTNVEQAFIRSNTT